MSHLMDDKIFSIRGVVGSEGQICKFLSPFHQFRTGVAINLYVVYIYILACPIYGMTKYPKGATRVMGLRAKIVNFGTPFVHLEKV